MKGFTWDSNTGKCVAIYHNQEDNMKKKFTLHAMFGFTFVCGTIISLIYMFS